MATELWTWQDGTSSSDYIEAVVMYPDGSSVLAGYTEGNWTTTNAGSSDFMAVKLAVNGSVVWKWQDGTGSGDYIYAAAGSDEGSVIIAGYTGGSYGAVHAGSRDFVAVKIDGDGNTVWKWQDGTAEDDRVNALAMGDDGSMVLVGVTNGNWNTTSTGHYDCVAIKLDANGTVAWNWQGGTIEYEHCLGVAMADDGSVVVVGYTGGDWGDVNAGGSDFIAVKLDAAGEEVWVWQDGTSYYEAIYTAVATEGGYSVLAGYTSGSWGSTNTGSWDFAAVKLDADGTVEWKWQEGSSGLDIVKGAIALNGGSVVLSGNSAGDWSGTHIGGEDFAALELDPDGTVLWRWQDGTADKDMIKAVGSDGDSRVLLAGFTEGDWTGVNAGDRDFAAVVIELPTSDTPAPSLPDTPAPSLPPTVAPTPSPTPSPTTERSTIAPSSATMVPLNPLSPPPSSIPVPSSSPQTALPATETPGPSSTRSAGSSSTSTATVAGTVAAAVFVVILLLAVWIWRRNTKRQGEGAQYPRSVQENQNAPYPVADRPAGYPAIGRGSVNPVDNDVPPPDYSTVSGGTSHVGERMPAQSVPATVAVQSTNPLA